MFLAVSAQAMAGTYMALFIVNTVGATPIELTVFMTVQAISGIALTWLFGNWLDRTASRLPLILSLVGMIVAYAVMAVNSDKLTMVFVALVPLGLGAAAFPQIFAGAKGSLDDAGPVLAAQGMAALRTASSLSWAIGPAAAAIVVALWGISAAFIGGAVCGVVALLLATSLRPHRRDRDVEPTAGMFRIAGPVFTALTLSTSAMFIGSTAMSVVTVTELKGTATDVGLLFSLCAAIEVPVMGWFIIRPIARATRGLLIVGFLCFAAYFAVNLLLPGVATLYWTQVLRAVAIGLLSVVGMQYIQELMPTRPGAASALFSNIANVSVLLSGLSTGTWAASFGYLSLFGLCAALCLAGAAIVAVIERDRSTGGPNPANGQATPAA